MQDEIVKSLDVYWNGRKVGSYDKFQSGSEQFVYDAVYLAQTACQPISHSLPLRVEPYSAPQLRPFFSGLLPEEAQRTRIASYLGIAETNDFAFLEAIGGECAGALTILPKGTRPSESETTFKPMSESELASVIETLPLRPMLVGEKGVRTHDAPLVNNGQRITATVLDNDRDLLGCPVEFRNGKVKLTKAERRSAAFFVTFEF